MKSKQEKEQEEKKYQDEEWAKWYTWERQAQIENPFIMLKNGKEE